MQFDWNSGNTEHIARHEITPEEAEQVVRNDAFNGGGAIRNGEWRTSHLGETDAGRILFIIVTERGERYRVVTARPARRNERAFYSNYKAACNDNDSGYTRFQE